MQMKHNVMTFPSVCDTTGTAHNNMANGASESWQTFFCFSNSMVNWMIKHYLVERVIWYTRMNWLSRKRYSMTFFILIQSLYYLNTYHMAAMAWLIVYVWYSMIMTLTIWTMHVCYCDFNNAIYWFYLLYTILCSCERDSINSINSISQMTLKDVFRNVNYISMHIHWKIRC